MKVPNIKSGFAFLDVKSGRKTLEKITNSHRVPVTIKGFINCPSNGDDGTSIEFEVEVDSVKLGAPKAKKVA